MQIRSVTQCILKIFLLIYDSIIIEFHKNILLGDSAALRQSNPFVQDMLCVCAFQIF